MASISTSKQSGRRMIQFVGSDGRRRTLRLGKVPMKLAESVKLRVERLNAAKLAGHAVDDDTARWVGTLDDTLHAKLAAVGLVEARGTTTLAAFVDGYIRKRVDVKPATLTVWGHTRRNLVEFFGEHRSLRSITRGDAESWRLHLVGEGLAEATVRKRCGFAKQFLEAAVQQGLLQTNPLRELKSASQTNTRRQRFITQDGIAKVIAHAPDAEWALIFALARFGGLRIPSEVLPLRWQDVNWAEGTILVHSPKTEHHAGGETRLVPLFSELRPFVEAAFDQADEGANHLIERHRGSAKNWRTHANRIITRAGMEPWPKTFVNLRASRATELAERFPAHVAAAWMGHTQAVAERHYWQTTESHFRQATSAPTALQNPMQSGAESARIDSQADGTAQEEPRELRGFATAREAMQCTRVEDRGLEPLTFWLPARRSPN